MSWTLTALALTTLLPAPQEPSAQAEPQILSAAEVKSLNRKARSWMEAWRKYEFEADSPKARRKQQRSLSKAREAFKKEWESKSKKSDLLASMADCQAVFANCFEYDRTSTSGNLKMVKAGDDREPAYGLVAARGYDPENAYRSVLVIPGWDSQREAWTPMQEWFDATWNGSSIDGDTIFVLPSLDAGLELDSAPSPSDPTAEAKEDQRVLALLGAAGRVQREFNLDRQRMLLDCGRGSNAFGLRLASYFPILFAGLVLRDPIDVSDEIRIGSLTGLPILMIASADNKEAVGVLSKKLAEFEPGSVTVLEAKGDYPYPEMQAEIAEWVGAQQRKLYRHKVVIEPNSDRFNDAYWVQIGTAEPLANLAIEDKPRMVVEADRENNRINVDARGVTDFTLLLNDELVDLGKPFTVVINGVAEKQELRRNLREMVQRMQNRFDPSYLFTTQFNATVPADTGDTGN